jgi:hypothetical protein
MKLSIKVLEESQIYLQVSHSFPSFLPMLSLLTLLKRMHGTATAFAGRHRFIILVQ